MPVRVSSSNISFFTTEKMRGSFRTTRAPTSLRPHTAHTTTHTPCAHRIGPRVSPRVRCQKTGLSQIRMREYA
jgi:hypothetical protein